MKTKKKFVNLTPKSMEAKMCFFSMMNSFHGCEVLEETEELFFLLSLNKECTISVHKSGNDHWKVER
jgi:hypothetical protein